jgi:hypothetical protein
MLFLGRHCLYPSKGDDESCGILLAEQFDAWEVRHVILPESVGFCR